MQSQQEPARHIILILKDKESDYFLFNSTQEEYSLINFTYNPNIDPWDNMATARFLYELKQETKFDDDENLVSLYLKDDFKQIVGYVNEGEVVHAENDVKIIYISSSFDFQSDAFKRLSLTQINNSLNLIRPKHLEIVQQYVIHRIQDTKEKVTYAIIEDNTTSDTHLKNINLALFLGLYQEANENWKYYQVFKGQYPTEEEMKQIQGYVITGSPLTAYIHEEWYPTFFDFLQRILSTKTKTIGTCFGHQIVAEAFGGQTGKLDNIPVNEVVHSGPKQVRFIENQKQVRVNVSHGDYVVKPPPNSKVLMSSDYCAIMSYLSHEGSFLGVQFHPEFSAPLVKYLITEMPVDTKASWSKFNSDQMKLCHDPIRLREKLITFLKRGEEFNI